ncbi:pilus assembly protein PilP [Billgrantia gudaonensis]|uniref:Type IV pilus assembly protein PilP n=1 Tax=Billgrantia gudaonensis TaxID=376427 RepID=A0A1G8RK19_9GAMM|nr:pilus assembly protein PilP [Halomonas gudaonensis]SDJ17424.1 type IV pilus assembly protein PilP [Halomonas gudaonensis]
MRWLQGITMAVTLGLVAGCADPQLAALDRELAAIREDPGPTPEFDLPEVPTYEATPYREADSRSPFRPRRLEADPEASGEGQLAPDPDRRKEPLEAFALEELELVGVLTVGGEPSALVRTPDGQVHRLHRGNHLGGNHGRIVAITHSSVQLVELVPTGGGGWVERTTRLTLDDET